MCETATGTASLTATGAVDRWLLCMGGPDCRHFGMSVKAGLGAKIRQKTRYIGLVFTRVPIVS